MVFSVFCTLGVRENTAAALLVGLYFTLVFDHTKWQVLKPPYLGVFLISFINDYFLIINIPIKV